MNGPGRESAASLTTAAVSALPERPEPPEYLTPEQAVVWRDVVATKPADWFMRDSHPVLASYCKAAVLSRDLAARLESVDIATAEVKDFKLLVELSCKTAKLAADLATKLRLTQQSRYTPQAAATANKKASGARPWETGKTG